MMLHTLLEQGKRLGLDAEAGFVPKTVHWLIVFDGRGHFLNVLEQSEPGAKRRGRTFPKVPHLRFAGDTPMRQFLVDTAHYALLYGVEKPDDKLLAKHRYFLNLLCEAAATNPVFGVLAKALADESVRSAVCAKLEEGKAKTTDNITFAIQSADGVRILVNETVWHDWWRGFFPTLLPQKSSERGEMRCLLTGELTEPERTHPKIKGLAGVGGKVETTLVGFNEPAFCSFGLDQSRNAAVSKEAAEQYAAALNHLIEHNSVTLPGAKVVYWYDRDVERADDPVRMLLGEIDFGEAEVSDEDETPAPSNARKVAQAEARARHLLEAVLSGERPDLAGSRYYALTLSGNSARVVVRDWMEGQFEELAANIDAWFDDLAIVRREGSDVVRSHKFAAVLAAPVRELKDIAAPSVATLWHVAIRCQPIPHQVMAQTLARTRLDVIQDRPPLHGRYGILKAYCIRKGIMMTATLDEHQTHPAYLCGRIMAVLAAIQHAALGDVGAGVVQRYYAAASSTPALVLGRLVRLAQTGHLPKIEPDALRNWFEKQLAQLWQRFDQAPPKVLSLEQQTLFAMGFYQQKAERYAGKAERDSEEAPRA